MSETKPLIPQLKKGWENTNHEKKNELINSLVDQIASSHEREQGMKDVVADARARMTALRDVEKELQSKKNQMHHMLIALIGANVGLIKLSSDELLNKADYLVTKLDEPLAKFYASDKG